MGSLDETILDEAREHARGCLVQRPDGISEGKEDGDHGVMKEKAAREMRAEAGPLHLR